MIPVNLAQKLALFDAHWDPKVVATYNGNDVMVIKFQGEFPYHKHDDTDDFFLVLNGECIMDYENADSVTFGPGELVVVPKGQIHRPRAEKEVQVLLIEPIGEPNSGDSGVTPAAKDHI